MLNIDEDTITQAVIARHAMAGNTRLREVMTNLVQHLHAFARDAQLTEAEWVAGLQFLGECARVSGAPRDELRLLSDTLGLTALVTTQNQRGPRGTTESTLPASLREAPSQLAPTDEPCYLRGRVRGADLRPVAGAQVSLWPSDAEGAPQALVTDAQGAFLFRGRVPAPAPIPHDGPVGRLLAALGRHPWRPAYLGVAISAPGHAPLATQLFRDGDPYLDSDAVFGVRRALVAPWLRQASGLAPDGRHSEVPYLCIDYTFVLSPTVFPPRADALTTGDQP